MHGYAMDSRVKVRAALLFCQKKYKKNVIQLIDQPVSITEAYRKFSSYMLET